MSVVIRPSIPDDFKQIEKQLPFRVKSLTGLVDGRVIGVGGIGFMPDGVRQGFTYLTDEARSHPKELHFTAKKFLKQMKEEGVTRIVALADMEVSAKAENWLKYLGFEMIEQGGEKVWLWRS